MGTAGALVKNKQKTSLTCSSCWVVQKHSSSYWRFDDWLTGLLNIYHVASWDEPSLHLWLSKKKIRIVCLSLSVSSPPSIPAHPSSLNISLDQCRILYFSRPFILAIPHGMWDLRFPTTDQTHWLLHLKHRVLTTGPPGKLPEYFRKIFSEDSDFLNITLINNEIFRYLGPKNLLQETYEKQQQKVRSDETRVHIV